MQQAYDHIVIPCRFMVGEKSRLFVCCLHIFMKPLIYLSKRFTVVASEKLNITGDVVITLQNGTEIDSDCFQAFQCEPLILNIKDNIPALANSTE